MKKNAYRAVPLEDFLTDAILYGRSRCVTPFYLEFDEESNEPGEAYAIASTAAMGNLHTTVCNYFGGGAPFCFRWKASNTGDFPAFSEENKAYRDALLEYLKEGGVGDTVWVRDNSGGVTVDVDGVIPKFHLPKDATYFTGNMTAAQLAVYAWDFASTNDHAAFNFSLGDKVFRVVAINVADSKILLWDMFGSGDFHYCDLSERVTEGPQDFVAIFAEYLDKHDIVEAAVGPVHCRSQKGVTTAQA